MRGPTSFSIKAERLDDFRVRLRAPNAPDVTLFASPDVPIDRASLADVGPIAGIAATIDELDQAAFFGGRGGARFDACILTPDFHRGSGIPVGTVLQTKGAVLPRLAGSDIGCGMGLFTTDLREDDLAGAGPELDRALRAVFFEGRRDIPMDAPGRQAILRDGLLGLRPPPGGGGLWRRMPTEVIRRASEHAHTSGRWETREDWAFGDYIRGSGGVSRDAQIGSLSGGNHFLEIQVVEEVLDRHAAWHWGLKPGAVTIMVHNGSLDLGGAVANHFLERAKSIQPRGIPLPWHGFHPLPLVGDHQRVGEDYLNAMGLAANFAVVNRFMLGLMAAQALSGFIGREVGADLMWDAAHNAVWASGDSVLHRKGATPAEAGEPVLVPGSMGDASYVMKGLGQAESLQSAPHGAGRITSRGDARKAAPADLEKLRVVGPVDLATLPQRIRKEAQRSLMEEAPRQYKPILPVVETTERAGMASPVVRLRPLLTVKR